MRPNAVWGACFLFALGSLLAAQVGTRVPREPEPSTTTIRVPEDVADLQEAIWMSSPGGLILLGAPVFPPWGGHSPVTIDRPLAIVGNPYASIEMGWWRRHGIRLDGPGYGRVTLAGLNLWNVLEPGWTLTGISGGGFDELHVIDCSVTVFLLALSGGSLGGSAIEVDVPLVVLSNVYAESAQPDVDQCIGTLWGVKNAAVEAPNSTVVVVDSELVGGDGGYLCCLNCTCPSSLAGLGGEGGDALVAREAYVANSTLTGGRGSTYFTWSAGTGQIACGTQPDGVPMVVDNGVLLDDDLRGASYMQAGAPYTLSWTLATSMVWIWVSDELQAPTRIGPDALSFLTPGSTVLLGVFPVQPNAITFRVPSAHGWIGKHFVFQAVSLKGTVTRPVIAGIRY